MSDAKVIDAQKAFLRTVDRLPTLFDIEEQVLQIADAMEAAEGDVTDDQRDLLAAMQTLLEEKLEAYCHVIESVETLYKSRKAAADRLRDRARAHERTVDALKQRLLEHLQRTGQERVETVEYTVRVQRNSRPTITVLEQLMVPATFHDIVTTDVINKDRVLQHVKETGEVPEGIDVVHGSHVRIY